VPRKSRYLSGQLRENANIELLLYYRRFDRPFEFSVFIIFILVPVFSSSWGLFSVEKAIVSFFCLAKSPFLSTFAQRR
jgi:hypothetical protein